MKHSKHLPGRNLLFSVFFFAITQTSFAQGVDTNCIENTEEFTAKRRTCNFYIFTQDASKKFDFLGSTALARIWIKRLFVKKKLYVIVAKNSEQVVNKIISIVTEKEAVIGNLWFDSHGLYRQGYSSFHIGSDEFSYKNINDSVYIRTLKQLAGYCDAQSNVGIGSCYGGATFNFPGSANVAEGRMNGDSLMIGMGKIFSGATIYGSESWVMMKPGMYNNNFGFAGYPLGKKYCTTYWKPVWERLGQWNRYSTSTGVFEPINTAALNSEGKIHMRLKNYQELKKGKKAVGKNLNRLETKGKFTYYKSNV